MIKYVTHQEILKLADELLDDESKRIYGETHGMQFFLSSLGLAFSSAVHTSDGKPIYSYGDDSPFPMRAAAARYYKNAYNMPFVQAMAIIDTVIPEKGIDDWHDDRYRNSENRSRFLKKKISKNRRSR